MSLTTVLGKFLAVAAAVLFLSSSTDAATPYRPSFDKDKTVYTDPSAGSNATLPVDFNGLAGDLEVAGKKHNVTYYFVFIEEADENFDTNTNFALPVLKQILTRWWNEPGFDRDRHVLTVHVRKKGTRFGGKTAVEAGPALKKMGLTGSRFDQRNGPVMTAVFDHMRNSTPSHRKFVLAICENCNDDLTRYIASQTPPQQSNPPSKTAPQRPSSQPSNGNAPDLGVLYLITFVMVAGVGLVFWLVIAGKHAEARKELHSRISKRGQELHNASLELIDFVNTLKPGARPGDAQVFTGETAAAQSNIASRVTDVRVAIALLGHSVDSAAAVVGNWFALDVTRRKLDGYVAVTSALDGKSTKFPLGSQHSISALTQALSLDSLKAARDNLNARMGEAATYANAIQARVDLKARYLQAELPLGLLAAEDAKHDKTTTALSSALSTDPLKALWEQRVTFEQLGRFNAQLEAGLRTKAQHSALEAALTQARTVAAAARRVKLELHYTGKLIGTADATPRTVEVIYHSEENPETWLQRASERLTESRAALCEGKPILAEELASNANTLVVQFSTELKALNNARLTVKREVPAAETAVEHLKDLIDQARQRVDSTEPLYPHEADAIAEARALVTAAALAHAEAICALNNCAEQFMDQRFGLAKTSLESCKPAFERCTGALSELKQMVDELERFKEHATQTSSTAEQIQAQLAVELPKGTTDATRDARATAAASLAALAEVMATQPVNWRVAAGHAQAVDQALVNLGEGLKADKKSYGEAIEKVEKARKRGCPSSKRSSAQDAADSGNYNSVDGFLLGYLAGTYSSSSSGSSSSSSGSSCSSGSSSGSSCSSSSGSSCGSSCGGGGCGGGGCGGS